MNFNSLQFLIFFALVLLLYWLLPHKFRWILLLAASYYFYMSWNPGLIFLIVGTTAVSYVAALLIAKTDKRAVKKAWFIVTLVVCLGALFFFKYFDFLVASVVDFLRLFSLRLDGFALDLILPVGISFYTFQTLSYVIDVYRGTIEPERHFGYYALFVSFFPQLVAGPIERADSLIPQLRAEHKLCTADMDAGFKVMLCGFFRKCVVADFCGIFVNRVFGDLAGANSLSVFLAAALFLVQIYGDFAGYSEIAMGAARMMGIRLMKNFDRPYFSVSFAEFFRRWHISLNKWFTDYLYIPLGGNRKGKARKILNVWIVFLLCGLWHGANWTYVLWGAYVAVFVSLENLFAKPVGAFFERHGVDLKNEAVLLLRRVLFFVLSTFGAVLFRAADVQQAGEAFRILFTGFGGAFFDTAFSSLGMTALDIFTVVLSIVCMAMLYGYSSEPEDPPHTPILKAEEHTMYAQNVSVFFYLIVAIAGFWLLLLASSDVSAFLYFQF